MEENIGKQHCGKVCEFEGLHTEMIPRTYLSSIYYILIDRTHTVLKRRAKLHCMVQFMDEAVHRCSRLKEVECPNNMLGQLSSELGPAKVLPFIVIATIELEDGTLRPRQTELPCQKKLRAL